MFPKGVRREQYLSIVEKLIEAGLEAGLVQPVADWIPQPWEKCVRGTVMIDGYIPCLIEMEPASYGEQRYSWALYPVGEHARFPVSWEENSWPGAIWGTGIIDRHIGFRLLDLGRFHCRRKAKALLTRFQASNS